MTGIDCVTAREDAGFFLGEFRAVEIALGGGFLAVGFHSCSILRFGESLDKRMLGRDHHVGGTEQRVGPSRVDAEDVVARLARESPSSGVAAKYGFRFLGVVADEKIDFRAGASADPVPLQRLDAFGPIDELQIFFQPARRRP